MSSCRAVLLLVVSIPAGCGSAEREDAQSEPLLPGLGRSITLNRTGTLAEHLADLREELDLNIVLDPETADHEIARIPREIVLRDVTGWSALRWVTRIFGVSYAIRKNVLVVTLHEDEEALVQKLYDIKSILAPRPRRPDVRVAIPEARRIGFRVTFEEPGESPIGEELLVDLIREFIQPGSWEGERTFEVIPGGSLIVTCEERTHRELAEFLETIKSLAPPPVTVSARILRVDAPLDKLPFGRLSPEALAAFEEKFASEEDVELRVVGALGRDSIAHFMEKKTAVTDYEGPGKPFVGTFVSDLGVLKILPAPRAGSEEILIDLELILGWTRLHDPPLKDAMPGLKCPEGTLSQFRATVPVRPGGGALLSLPRSSADTSRRTVCLVKASTETPLPFRPGSVVLGKPVVSETSLIRRVKSAVVPEIQFRKTPLADAAAILRRRTGVNILVRDEERNFPVTLALKNATLHDILSFIARHEKLEMIARDEAVYVGIAAERFEDLRVVVADVRDLVFIPEDFDRPGTEKARAAFTGEDIASLILNTVARHTWEEADGKTLWYDDGILYARNTPAVLAECKAFLARARRSRPPVTWVSTTSVVLSQADADRILKAGRGAVNTAVFKALLGASRRTDHLAWPAMDVQRTYQQWGRYRSHVTDWEKKQDPVMDVATATSWLQVRTRTLTNGRTVLESRFRGEDVIRVSDTPVGDGFVVQSPEISLHESSGSTELSVDGWTLARWAAGADADGTRLTRLLLLKVAPPEPRD